MKRPLITIIIPSYNTGEYLEETLKSIFSQNYKNYEVIVQDGGSTDNTVDILKKYQKKYPDKLNWVSKKDKGQMDAINKGMKKAKGEIVAYINADDVYEKGAFQVVVNAYKNNPDSGWFVGQGKVINKTGSEIAKYATWYKNLFLKFSTYSLLLTTNYIIQPSVFLTKKAYKKFGPFTGTKSFVMEYDLWLKMGKEHMPVVINDFLSSFRMSGDNISATAFDKTLSEDEKIVTKYTNNPMILFLHKLHNEFRKVIVKII